MSDSMVLEHLRAIRDDIAEMKRDIKDLKQRVTTVACQYASLASRASDSHRTTIGPHFMKACL